MAEIRITRATEAVLRVLLDDPGAHRYGLEVGATTGLPSALSIRSWPDWRISDGFVAIGSRSTRRPKDVHAAATTASPTRAWWPHGRPWPRRTRPVPDW